jgi:hypothetical protein
MLRSRPIAETAEVHDLLDAAGCREPKFDAAFASRCS